MNINNIGELLPGKAYFVLMSEAGIVDFTDFTPIPAFPLEGEGDGRRAGSPLLLEEKGPGVEVIKTPSTHTVAILPEALRDFEPGTIIAAYDQNGNCFGATVYDNETISLTAFGDDPTTEDKDGFFEGEMILFQNLSGLKDLTGLNPTFDPQLPSADGRFTENGLSAITAFKASTGISENIFSNAIHIYPNPSSGKFCISGLPTGAMMKIVDMQGTVIFTSETTTDTMLNLDLGVFPAGVYLISVEYQNKNAFHKLILK
jgi:hypothetical protein